MFFGIGMGLFSKAFDESTLNKLIPILICSDLERVKKGKNKAMIILISGASHTGIKESANR